MLGPVHVLVDGERVRGLRRSSLELLAYLAVHPRGVTRDAAIADLWPDDPLRSARRRFHDAVYSLRAGLRRATGDRQASFVLCEEGGYRLDDGRLELDLWEFEAGLAKAAAGGALPELERAVELYRGRFAGGEAYEWSEPVEAALRRRAANALSRIAEAKRHDRPEEAIVALERAIALDPYTAEPYERLIRLENQLGRSDAARRTHALMRARLAEITTSRPA